MANRRTSRGQPQFLRFRPYQAIVAGPDHTTRGGNALRAFFGGLITWFIVAALLASFAGIGLGQWLNGNRSFADQLVALTPWILIFAAVAGFLGGMVKVARR